MTTENYFESKKGAWSHRIVELTTRVIEEHTREHQIKTVTLRTIYMI